MNASLPSDDPDAAESNPYRARSLRHRRKRERQRIAKGLCPEHDNRLHISTIESRQEMNDPIQADLREAALARAMARIHYDLRP